MKLARREFIGELESDFVTGPLRACRLSDDGRHRVPRHSHEAAHFCVVLRGVYHTEAGPASGSTVSAGAVIYNPAGVVHDDGFRGGGTFLTVSLDRSFVEDCPREFGRVLASRVVMNPVAAIAAFRLNRALTSGADLGAAVEAAVDDFVSTLLDDGRCDTAPDCVRRAQEVMHDAEGLGMRVHEIAAGVGVHPVTLARLFRRTLGISPSRYLQELRVGRALSLLEENHPVSLTEVALRAGFCDQAHLTRAMTGRVKCSPARWRREVAHSGSTTP